MRSKYRRRQPPPQELRPRAGGRTVPILVGLVLVVLGAALALTVERLVPGTPGQAAHVSPAPSALPQVASSPSASAQAVASIAPTALPSPAAPALEAQMPRTINGTVLTIKSATNAASLGGDPSSRALSAAMTSLGKKPGDLEIAEAYDPSGALALTVLGFRVPGVDPVKLRSVVLEALAVANRGGHPGRAPPSPAPPPPRFPRAARSRSRGCWFRGRERSPAFQATAPPAVAALPTAPSPRRLPRGVPPRPGGGEAAARRHDALPEPQSGSGRQSRPRRIDAAARSAPRATNPNPISVTSCFVIRDVGRLAKTLSSSAALSAG